MPASGAAPSHELFQRLIAVYVTQRVTAPYAEAAYVLWGSVVVEFYCQAFTIYSAASNDFAASMSFCVIPPSLCVDSVKTTSL